MFLEFSILASLVVSNAINESNFKSYVFTGSESLEFELKGSKKKSAPQVFHTRITLNPRTVEGNEIKVEGHHYVWTPSSLKDCPHKPYSIAEVSGTYKEGNFSLISKPISLEEDSKVFYLKLNCKENKCQMTVTGLDSEGNITKQKPFEISLKRV